MPKWTPELDAILLHGVFEECNISFSKALCAKIAIRVQEAGIECTAKAVENRLYSWKKKNTSGITNLNNATSTPTKKAAAAPKTPGSGKKATPRKKKEKLEEDSEGSRGLPVIKSDSLSPTPIRRKRKAGQTSYAESQSSDGDIEDLYTPKKSKVKMEPKEEDLTTVGLDGSVI